jgi:hypothetical protein
MKIIGIIFMIIGFILLISPIIKYLSRKHFIKLLFNSVDLTVWWGLWIEVLAFILIMFA